MKKIINNGYFQVGFLTFLLLSLIYIVKGVFPFGDKISMWSDLHEQITPMYYKFYDAVYGNGSLFIDYNTGGGINLAGVFSYYIMSPFTLLILLFPRDYIFEATSLIIMGKMIAASLTSYYFLNVFFKKLTNNYKILLSLLYAFSIYSLFYYIITGWMDGMYMFPLILIGLKKLLDNEGNKFYIIALTISLIFSFYTALLTLLFIFFASFFYIYYYKKENFKQCSYNLGISTLIALLISGITIIPTYYELALSARTRLDIPLILNSKFGPLIDKIALFFASAPLIVMNFLNLRKNNKFTKFFYIIMLLVLIPVIIEPINKFLHFGSYMYLPLRFGFIPIFLLVIGGAYYLENKKKVSEKSSNLGIIFSILTVILTLFTYKYYDVIKLNINKLSLSYDKKVFLILFALFLMMIMSFYYLFTKKNKYNLFLINFLIILNLLFNMSIYVGSNKEESLRGSYETMNKLAKIDTSYYRVKILEKDLVMNFGMVTKSQTFTQFSSMIDKMSYDTMQRLGYDSYSMDTQTIGGNIFIDSILANKYILTKQNLNNSDYVFDNKIDEFNLYRNDKITFGYILNNNNISLSENGSSFENSNIIYNAISNDNDLFVITKIKEDDITLKKGENIEFEVEIEEDSNLYLEMFKDFDFQDKNKIYKSFNIYVNDKLLYLEYPNLIRNGNLFLGEFNSNVNIKIEVLKDAYVRRIRAGAMSLDKYKNFMNQESRKINIDFNKNKINIKLDGSKGEYLFLPITYLDGYKSSHNIKRVFDNFILVELNEGTNNINISYTSDGLYLGVVITLIGIIFYFFLKKYPLTIIKNIGEYLYKYSFYLIFAIIYLGGLLAFLISFIYKFK